MKKSSWCGKHLKIRRAVCELQNRSSHFNRTALYLFYNKINLGKNNFLVAIGYLEGAQEALGLRLAGLVASMAIISQGPLEIFLKPPKTFHSNPVKVPRPLVALALAKNLDSVGPWCGDVWFLAVLACTCFLSILFSESF